MKNTLSDLNNHLFMTLERLNDEDLCQENLEEEINRSKAIVNVAKAITENASIILDAKKHFDNYGITVEDKNKVPEVLRIAEKT